MPRFLCVGDLHLDKGGRYGRFPGERLEEQEAVWERCLELAREHAVDAVLFAGDAFEKRHPSTDAMLAFERPLVAHRDAVSSGRALVYAIPGNHDRSGVSEWCALDVFNEPGMIYLHSRPGVMLAPGGVSIAFLPWAPVSRIVAAHDGGDRDDINAVAAELLLETARGLRASSEGPMILLTHFSISGAGLPGGMTSDQLREPVIPLAELIAVGFDAVVAGHLHPPQELTLPPEGPVFYVGSPMPLDFGEGGYGDRGDSHGVWLLDVDDASVQQLRFLAIESRPFVTLDVDTQALEWFQDNGGQLEDAIGITSVDDAFVKVRAALTEEAARRLDLGAFRATLLEDGAHNVWVEQTIERELRARVQGMDETVTDVDALEAWLTSQSVNGDQAPALRELHNDYLQEIS